MHAGDSLLELLLQNWVAILVVGAAVILPICAVLTQVIRHAIDSWRQSHVDQQRAANEAELIRLKQSMIERGMTAEEIERVLKAGPTG